MKCILCNERNGSMRCEGCQQLYCLPCMNKHHEELAHQFQLLTDIRNELKQSLDASESTSNNNQDVPCMVEINRWEREIVQRIRDIARKARTNVNEILAKNMAEMRQRFEQLSVDIQRRQKEGNHLENDIDSIKNQLEQLRGDIENVSKRIYVDFTTSKKIEWDTLIHVLDEHFSRTSTSKFAEGNNQSIIVETGDSILSRYAKLLDNIRHSSTRPSRKQPIIKQQNPPRRPVHFVKVESLSNSSDFEQKSDINQQYIECPICTYTQMVNSAQNGTEHTCEMCESIIQLINS